MDKVYLIKLVPYLYVLQVFSLEHHAELYMMCFSLFPCGNLKCLLHSRHLSQEGVSSTSSLFFRGKNEHLDALRFYGFWHHIQFRSAAKLLYYSFSRKVNILTPFVHCIALQLPCFILCMASIRRMSLDHYPGFDTVSH